MYMKLMRLPILKQVIESEDGDEKFIPGQVMNDKFVPGIIVDSVFIPGQVLRTDNGKLQSRNTCRKVECVLQSNAHFSFELYSIIPILLFFSQLFEVAKQRKSKAIQHATFTIRESSLLCLFYFHELFFYTNCHFQKRF